MCSQSVLRNVSFLQPGFQFPSAPRMKKEGSLITLCTVIYLVCWVLSVWLLCRSLKNWTFGLWAGQEWFQLCYLGIAQSGIGSWHVINTLMTSYGALLIYTSHYQVNKGSWEGLVSSTECKRCLHFSDFLFKQRVTFVLWGSNLI